MTEYSNDRESAYPVELDKETEIVEHWMHGTMLVKLSDGRYEILRGLLTDEQYIEQLKSHVISKHTALHMK